MLIGETVARTVSRLRRTEEELSRLALVDDLTGLANRRAFVTVGEQLRRVAERAGETVLVVYADLDGMKAINDRHGHAAGDEALRQAASLLRAAQFGAVPSLALSLGTAVGTPGCTIEDLISRADAAMYADKAHRSGRA